jgi:hypothetical protein
MTLSALGIFSAAGAGGVAFASDYEFIATATGTGLSNTISFSSIPQDYKHLQIRYTAKNTGSSDLMIMRMNGITTTVYSNHYLQGQGGGVLSSNNDTSVNGLRLWYSQSSSGSANAVSAGIIDVLDYADTVKHKTVRSLNGSAQDTRIVLNSGRYGQATAITSIALVSNSSEFGTRSQFALYGIRG